MNLQGVQRQTAVQVSRRVIPMTFSREFESILLNSPLDHESLSSDIEQAAWNGMAILDELLEVAELTQTEKIKILIAQTVPYTIYENSQFSHWHLSICEELLDDIDLALLTHGDDLTSLGFGSLTQSKMLVFLAISGASSI